MLQARLNLITGDRLRWGDLITFVEDQVRPAVESLHGSRDAVARRAAGAVAVERCRVPVFEGEARLNGGGGLRLSRMEIEPSRTEDLIEGYGDIAVPVLAETGGFCCALLLADRSRGHCIAETMARAATQRSLRHTTYSQPPGRTDGVDGWVSLEVSPLLARNTRSTINEAVALYRRAARGNLFIKMPAPPRACPRSRRASTAGCRST